ncbi:MAG: hypothetical protein K0B09_09775 [Bacteroidales bacterium]|nr:hypothetical protein [Bacteroidales bacterium]
MKITLKTRVNKDFHTVAAGFNHDLFIYLLPPFGMAKLERYDGQKPGDIVHIKFRLPFVNDFKVVIREVWTSPKEYRFVDRGLVMPFRLEFWQHIHRVVALGEKRAAIIDQMEFHTHWILLDYLVYPILFLSFFPRKWQYKRYFERTNPRA